MALAFKKGAKVRQKVKPIEGEVTAVHVVDDDVHFEVSFIGDDGESHSRVFTEAEIEAAGSEE